MLDKMYHGVLQGKEEVDRLTHELEITQDVKIPYAQLDIISIQFNFTTIAYAGSLKETQSQDRHKFILGNPLGEENPAKLPLYRCIKSIKTKPQTGAPSPCRYISLSPMRITQVSVCVQMRSKSLLFILYLPLDFFPNQVDPNKLNQPDLPRKAQNNIILLVGEFYRLDLQQRFYLMTL